MTGNRMKDRLAKIEAARPYDSNRLTRIVHMIVVPGPNGPVPTGEVIVQELP